MGALPAIRRSEGPSTNATRLRFPSPSRLGAANEPEHSTRELEERLAAVQRERDELQRVFFEAANLQRRLCGPRLLKREPFTIASELFPVHHISGDFISIFPRDEEVVFAIGDIAGKGLSAGMWFTHFLSLIRLRVADSKNLAAAMSKINQELCATGSAQPPLTSLFLGSLHLDTGVVTYSNAGHPPALLLRRSGGVESLDAGGTILGAVPQAKYSTGRSALQAGDSLLAVSDGVVECRNPAGAEFGIDRLAGVARRTMEMHAAARLFCVLGSVEDFAGSGRREDDIALLLLHRDECWASN